VEQCKKCGQVLASGEVGICADCYPDEGDETVLAHDPRVLAKMKPVEENNPAIMARTELKKKIEDEVAAAAKEFWRCFHGTARGADMDSADLTKAILEPLVIRIVDLTERVKELEARS